MADLAGSQPLPRLVPTEGSPVIVGRRDKQERIREAVTDLQLAIDGYIAQHSGHSGLSDSPIASLARHCSVFLRKLVIEDRMTRLLDNDICRTAEIGFSRIRRVPEDRRTLSLLPVDIRGGYMNATRRNDETSEPEAAYVVPIGAQRLEIDVEWPLPGMADWTEQPTAESPWVMKPEGLFDLHSEPISTGHGQLVVQRRRRRWCRG